MTINVEVTDISSCQKDLVIEAPAEVVQDAFNTVYKELSRHAQIPGFRPGKAPLSILKQRYRREAQEEVTKRLLPQFIAQALQERDLRLVSEPKITEFRLEEGQPLRLKATVEVYPKIEVGTYTGLRVQKEVKMVTEADVDRLLERLRERHVELIPVEERAAALGDVATVKLSATVVSSAGAPETTLDASQEEMVDIELGGQEVLPEFTDTLTGTNLGETRVVEVAYPENYQASDLAGKRLRYTATLETLRVKQLPELDDEFVKTVGEEFETLAEYRQELKRRLQRAVEEEAEEGLREQVLQQLVDQHRFEPPPTLVRQQLERRLKNLIQSLAEHGADLRSDQIDWKAIAAEGRESVIRDVRAALILQTIAERESIQVTDTEVNAEIARLAAGLRQSPLELKSRLTKGGALDTIKSELRNRKALDVVVKAAAVEEKFIGAG
jgi:trigger factor